MPALDFERSCSVSGAELSPAASATAVSLKAARPCRIVIFPSLPVVEDGHLVVLTTVSAALCGSRQRCSVIFP